MEIALPSTIDAKLPQTYEAARNALQLCATVDECKDWLDKSIALASYAKQANDETLLNLSNRIKARAVERMGQLFEQIEPARGSPKGQRGGSLTNGRESAAETAGISQDQRKQSQSIARFANENREQFEAAVESDKPPTIAALADMARGGANLSASTELLGTLKRFADYCTRNDVVDIAEALAEHETAAVLNHARTIVAWITDLASIITEDSEDAARQ